MLDRVDKNLKILEIPSCNTKKCKILRDRMHEKQCILKLYVCLIACVMQALIAL